MGEEEKEGGKKNQYKLLLHSTSAVAYLAVDVIGRLFRNVWMRALARVRGIATRNSACTDEEGNEQALFT